MGRKKRYKRNILIVLSAIVFVFSILGFCGVDTNAASYPLLYPDSYELEVVQGEVANIKYSYVPKFKNEEIIVEVYDSTNRLVASCSKTFYNSSTSIQSYTVTWDTTNKPIGRYTVKAICKFYSLYQWNEAPTPTTSYLTIKSSSNNSNTNSNDTSANTGSNDTSANTGSNDTSANTGSNDTSANTGSNDTSANTGSNDTGANANSNDASIGANGNNESYQQSKYANEWVNGKWYNADGSQTYTATLSWKNDSKGFWVEDSSGWYPQSQWQKIDGKWYYFTSSGYMDYSEYRDGCWLNSDGSMDDRYTKGKWHSDSKGWWYEDNGWYPVNQYVWIDGAQYWFGADGYWK